MKYFRPELYERLNSDDAEAVMKCAEKWRDASERYRDSLQPWIADAPLAVQKLGGKLSLHDADVVLWRRLDDSILGLVQTGRGYIFLHYRLTGEPVHSAAKLTGHPWTKRRNWLYDELSSANGHYLHRILFSNGETWDVPFSDLQILERRLSPKDRLTSTVPVLLGVGQGVSLTTKFITNSLKNIPTLGPNVSGSVFFGIGGGDYTKFLPVLPGAEGKPPRRFRQIAQPTGT
jgi:hypothetical protein